MEQSITQICPKHKRIIELANLSPSCQYPFLCAVCQIKNKNDQFIYIPEVLGNQETLPIQNWPLNIDQDILDFLSQEVQQDKSEKIKFKIQNFYKELLCQIMNQIDEQENEAMKLMDSLQLSGSNLIKFYNENFQRKELQEALKNLDLPQKYFQLLNCIETTKKKKLEELHNKIKLLDHIESTLDSGQPQQLKAIIKQLVKKINLFPQQINQNALNEEDSNIQSNKCEIADVLIQYLDLKDNLKALSETHNSINTLKQQLSEDNFYQYQQLIQSQAIQNQVDIFNNYYQESKQKLDQQIQELNKISDVLKQEFEQYYMIQISHNINSSPQQYNTPNNILPNDRNQPSINVSIRPQIQVMSFLPQQNSIRLSRVCNHNESNIKSSLVKYEINTSILKFISRYQNQPQLQQNQENNLVFPYDKNFKNIYRDRYEQNIQYFNQIMIDRKLTYIYKFKVQKQNILQPLEEQNIGFGVFEKHSNNNQKNFSIAHNEYNNEFKITICFKNNTFRVQDESLHYDQIIQLFYNNEKIKNQFYFYLNTNGNEVTLTYYEEKKHFVL
ncbi:hypothetical protein ABPG72_021185 [Tetrahymena utriculariae]